RVFVQRNGVGDHELVQGGFLDALDGFARQHGVRAIGIHGAGATVLQGLGGLAQRAGGIDHVVHDQAGAAVDVADDVHDLGHIGARPALVDDGQVGFELLGQGPGAHHAADVGGHDHQVLEIAAPDVAQQDRPGVDVVHGDVE